MTSSSRERPERKCPICGAGEPATVGRPVVSPEAVGFVRHDYRVVRCEACRFYFVSPDIDFAEEEWRALYGSQYFEGLVPWWAKKKRRNERLNLDLLQRHSARPMERFLDVGCGEGDVLRDALGRGWAPYGVDITDNRTEAVRDERIRFTLGDIFQAHFPGEFFDAVYMNSVLEHVTDPAAHLSEIRRILRTGGVLHVGTPNEDSLFNSGKQILLALAGKGDISARLTPFKTPYHVSGFTRRSVLRAMERSGFEIVNLTNFAGEYEWLKYKPFTRAFFIHMALLPVHLFAIPLRRQIYFDVVARKTG
ncbi:MAG: methyltransferase domain-containing protein [Candidatus Eisenbacteria bacterium]